MVAAAVGEAVWPLGTEEGFNAAVVEDIAVDVEDIAAAAETNSPSITKSPSTVAVEADFEVVVEFIAVDVEALRQIVMMPR